MEVPPQDVITRDNVTVKVNAVITIRVVDPAKAVIEVSNTFIRRRSWRRPRCAACWARRNWTNC